MLESIVRTDYSDKNNWMKCPDEIEHDVDILYFYPTSFMPSYEGEKCTIDNESMRAGAQMVYSQQATAFEGLGNIFVPYYRQVDAAILAGLDHKTMTYSELGEPTLDVFDALDHYFENINNGRPFILAGHSQGAMMIMITISRYMRYNREIYSRMIAAYMIGNAATKEWLRLYPFARMAQCADDTGVIISWNTEGPGNIGEYNMVVPEGSVCINPLNWTVDGTPADVSENKGSLKVNPDGTTEVVPGIADARVDLERGSVIVSTVDPETYAVPAKPLFGPESYHGNDYSFFYQNIRENAKLRIDTYLKK